MQHINAGYVLEQHVGKHTLQYHVICQLEALYFWVLTQGKKLALDPAKLFTLSIVPLSNITCTVTAIPQLCCSTASVCSA